MSVLFKKTTERIREATEFSRKYFDSDFDTSNRWDHITKALREDDPVRVGWLLAEINSAEARVFYHQIRKAE